MCQADSPVYLAVNWKYKDTTNWYKAQPMGIHKVNDDMKILAEQANLTGKKQTILQIKQLWRSCVG